MTIRQKLYQAGAYVKHLFSSWNTGGEGIHSPYLFYLVRMLIYDDNSYYCWREIESQRRSLLGSDEHIEVVDYGSGAVTTGDKVLRRVGVIAGSSLELPKVGQILFRLVGYVGHVQKRPLRIVELGTSLGITTAYLAMPDSRNSVTTYEGSTEIVHIARKVWENLGIHNINVVQGNIDETCVGARRTHARDNIKGVEDQVDIAYLDANHTYEATVRYFDHLARQAHQGSIFVLDDIHYSPEMAQAWREIRAREDVTTTMDMYHFGLVFFDKHYLKRHYKLRI